MSMIANFLRVADKELEEYKKDSQLLEDRIYNDDNDPNFIEIGKSWDGIIYLLTGDNAENATGELLNIIFSGQLIDEEQDLGYGPAHYLKSEQVKEMNKKISGIGIEELRQRFKPDEMTNLEVYPWIWEEGEMAFEYLFDNFEELRKFYSAASENDQAIISAII